MEQNVVMLLGSGIFAALAALFSIIAVATPGWSGCHTGIFSCGKYYTATGALLIISIIMLTIIFLCIAMFFRGILSNTADKIKIVVVLLLFLSGIFIVSGYSSPLHDGEVSRIYSYHLAVAAGIFTYISTILFTFYAGHTSVRNI